MIKCTNCGTEFAGKFCPTCGFAPNRSSDKTEFAADVPERVVKVQEIYTTVWGWIGWGILLTYLPVIGEIIMLCCSKDRTVKNYAIVRLIDWFIMFASLGYVIYTYWEVISEIIEAIRRILQ